MKTKLAICLLTLALLPACETTKKSAKMSTGDYKSTRYANNSMGEPTPPAEGPEADIPAEGPADVNRNPAYVPSPLLRGSAAASP
jgi:hypothetical protein